MRCAYGCVVRRATTGGRGFSRKKPRICTERSEWREAPSPDEPGRGLWNRHRAGFGERRRPDVVQSKITAAVGLPVSASRSESAQIRGIREIVVPPFVVLAGPSGSPDQRRSASPSGSSCSRPRTAVTAPSARRSPRRSASKDVRHPDRGPSTPRTLRAGSLGAGTLRAGRLPALTYPRSPARARGARDESRAGTRASTR